ncbi:MAG: molybdopterin molybdenumtransferase MoeA, partial [Eggerthellaceae bacterium]|nr:molybdopterin molybdenumtransferase MoeA [Eggerthellaceae bacterium]
VLARLTKDVVKKDPRRILMRSNLRRGAYGLEVTPAENQSSGLFSVLQRTNCMAIMPEGLDSKYKGDEVECLLLEVPESMNI